MDNCVEKGNNCFGNQWCRFTGYSCWNTDDGDGDEYVADGAGHDDGDDASDGDGDYEDDHDDDDDDGYDTCADGGYDDGK